MKKVFLTFFSALSVFANQSFAGDHLHPEEGVFDSMDEPVYEQALKRFLIKSSYRQAQMVTLPSFRQEEAVYIAEGDKPEIRSSKIARTSLWAMISREISKGSNQSIGFSPNGMKNALKKIKVSVEEHSAPIQPSTAELLSKVWELALAQTKYPAQSQLGLDGVRYHFANWKKGEGYKAGNTWSPKQGTKMAELVELAQVMTSYATATRAQRAAIEKTLLSKAKALEAKLK